VRSDDINVYLKEIGDADFSAKDFRTWNATVIAAMALAVSGEVAASETGRKRAINRAVKETAHYLGNTPAVCRASYIDPRVFDAYQGGLIIAPVMEEAAALPEGELPIHHRAVEEAVLDLIDERSSAPGVMKIAA
jgi:DNA topoisomerase I